MTGCVGEKRRGRERTGWRAGWAGWLRGALAGPAWEAEAQGGLLRRLLLHFYFCKTNIETKKHRVKGEELEHKENTLQLLELSTILINCIGHF